MKSKIIVSIFCFVTSVTNMYSQTATSINIQDTRAVNDLPNFIGFGMRADFKQIASIGVPGEGYYSTNITIAPWNTTESSGGKNHQMNFNAGGIFYRNAFPTDPQWGSWRQVLMTSENGNVGIGTSDSFTKVTINSGYGGQNGYGINYTNNVSASRRWYISNDNIVYGDFVINTETIQGSTMQTLNRFYVSPSGNVGIGTLNPTSKLTVAGNINSREVKVSVDAGADFVFEKDYALPSLQQVEKFITKNKHLPEIASAKEMQKEGINLSEMNIKLLQKIEEQTLYLIEISKEVNKLKSKISELEKK